MLHIYCTKVLVVKLYYSTYISQLWSGDSNQNSSKRGKRSNERFRGGIIFLLYWPEHGWSSLTESSHALISPRCGDSSPHLPLNPPPPSVKLEEENWAGPPVNEWEGNPHLQFELCLIQDGHLTLKSFIMMLETFFAGYTKENCQSLKLVSVHYRNKAWIKNIGVHSF